MLTVRFPNGQAVQYNSAATVETEDKFFRLREKAPRGQQQGRVVARVPLSCIIEFVPACRVYNALVEPSDSQLAREVKALRRRLDKALKEKKP